MKNKFIVFYHRRFYFRFIKKLKKNNSTVLYFKLSALLPFVYMELVSFARKVISKYQVCLEIYFQVYAAKRIEIICSYIDV